MTTPNVVHPLVPAVVLAVLAGAVAMAIVRAVRGPSAFDRVLAVNTIGQMAVLAICVYGYLDERAYFFDVALLYALINFVGVVAVLKYFCVDEAVAQPPHKQDGDSCGHVGP